MADEQQFIDDGLQRTQIDEFFHEELARAGYGGMEVAKTPMGTQIVLKAEKPGMVIGKGGKNIRKITGELESRFDLDDPQIDVQEVDEPDLNAQIVADRLANALERGWYFRKAGHTTIDRIMDSGALGAEIVLAGKVTGARARVEKFNRGYIKHNGEPAEEIVDKGKSVAVMKLGTIGVNVRIIPPNAELPDDFQVYEDVDVEEFVEEPEGDIEALMSEADEAIESETVAGPGAGDPSDDLAGDELAEEDIDALAAEEEEIVEEDVDVESGEAETAPPDSADRDAAEADLEEIEADIEAADVEEEAAEEAEELIEEMEAAEAEVDEQMPAETEDDAESAAAEEESEDTSDETDTDESDGSAETEDSEDEAEAEEGSE